MNAESQRAKRIAIVQITAAVSLLASLFLPWYTLGGPSYNFVGSASVSWVDNTPTNFRWMQDPESLLIALGAIVALVLAFLILIRSRRSVVLSALTLISFAAAVGGALWFLSDINRLMSSAATLSALLSPGFGPSASPGFGLWIFIAAAIIGALAAIIDLVASNANMVSTPALVPYPPYPTYYAVPGAPWQQPAGYHADPSQPAPPTAASGYPAAPGYPGYPNWPAPVPYGPNPPGTPNWSTPSPVSTGPAMPPIPQVAPASSPVNISQNSNAPGTLNGMKVCPSCAEEVSSAAKFCHFCSFDFAKGSQSK